MTYETAEQIIESATVELGLQSVSDPYASLVTEQIQLRGLLNQCGRELAKMYQWQQLVEVATISTGASPVATGRYSLPSDFARMINQTGWNPTNNVPLGGPLTRQQYAYLIGTELNQTTIYITFNFAEGFFEVLPAPAPANTTITYHYLKNTWVNVLGGGTSFATKATNKIDVIQFDPILISKMLVARYKTTKGLPAQASMQEFQNMFDVLTGQDKPAPVLNMSGTADFPYINPWTNLPHTGYGS